MTARVLLRRRRCTSSKVKRSKPEPLGGTSIGCRPWCGRGLRIFEYSLRPGLFADETTAPVLDPRRGRTMTGQLWAYVAGMNRYLCGGPLIFLSTGAPDRIRTGVSNYVWIHPPSEMAPEFDAHSWVESWVGTGVLSP